MKFYCKNVKDGIYIKGRHINYSFIVIVIVIYQFIFMIYPVLNWYTITPVLLLFLFYKSSWFFIEIMNQKLTIKKKAFGISYFKCQFNFKSYLYQHDSSISEFINDNQKIEFLYEEFEMDELGCKIDSNYYRLGSIENSNLTFKAIKSWIENN